MGKELDLDIFSIGYVAASFAATYFSGHDGRTANDNIVPKYSSLKNAFEVIYKTQGLKGLYKGFYISLLCQASSMSFFFWQYQTRKSQYEKQQVDKMKAVTLASIQASTLTTLITQPIWVVKTRMLLNVNNYTSQYQNFKRQLWQIKSQYGYKGFLKGLELSLLLSFSGVIQMYVYEGSKMLYERFNIPQSPFSEKHFLCGGMSKLFSVLLSYPITTMRTRIQQNQFIGNNNKQKYRGVSDIALRTFQNEGIKGFYKGVSTNLLRGATQRGIYFYFYEIFKQILQMNSSHSPQ